MFFTMEENMKKVEDYITSIKDFPKEGIIFRDITSVLQDKDGLVLAIDEMQKLLENVEFDVEPDVEAATESTATE